MYTFNSFLNTKKSSLNENLSKLNQEEAVIRAVDKGKLLGADAKTGGNWKFNESSNCVDFDTSIEIMDYSIKSLNDLGFVFGDVEGDFNCSGIEIDNLEGSPKICETFIASNSNLTSLKGCPYVVENFEVNNCLLRSLKESPRFIFGDFNASNNIIMNLSGGPLLISGGINLKGNGYPHDFNLFRNMHKFIMEEYMNVNPKITIKNIEKALSENEYFAKILSSNLNYIEFIKDYDDANLAEGILKVNPSPTFLSSIKSNLPLVWDEIIKIRGKDSGYETMSDLGDLGF